MGKIHINKHCVKHDYVLSVIFKTAQVHGLNVHANFISKLFPCHQHLREFVQCHKQNVPSELNLYIQDAIWVITAPADVLIPNSARTSASTMLEMFPS